MLIDHSCCRTGDRHLPTFLLDNRVRRLIWPPKRQISKFISNGMTVADIGSGPGHFTLPMAELVGSNGKVFAADSDSRSIEVLKDKTRRESLEGVVDAHVASATSLDFVPDHSIDFAFSNGVLCCMTDHEGAVAEIKRILKPDGAAYISVTRVFRRNDPRAVKREEWKKILQGFTVAAAGERLTTRWATVSLKQNAS